MTVGLVPNTSGLGLERVGSSSAGGYIPVDGSQRTTAAGIYAAGTAPASCRWPGGRHAGPHAMYHALGEGVPIRLRTVASATFTRPEIAAVGCRSAIDSGDVPAHTHAAVDHQRTREDVPLLRRGFVKIFCRPASGMVIGGVVVVPIASELILPIALAVRTAFGDRSGSDAFGISVAVGSIVEAARRPMARATD